LKLAAGQLAPSFKRSEVSVVACSRNQIYLLHKNSAISRR
jgi:hypothetical protein